MITKMKQIFIIILLALLVACTQTEQTAVTQPLPEAAIATAVPSPTTTASPALETAVPLTPSPTNEPATATPLPTSTETLAFPEYDCPVTLTTAVSTPPSEKIAVVYIGADGIYRWQETTGQSELIFPADDVTALKMSDDGQRIAFTRTNEASGVERIDLWIMDSDGRNGRLLLDEAGLRGLHEETESVTILPFRITWIPNGRSLAFSTIRYDVIDGGNIEGITAHRYDDLYVVDADSGAVNTLLPPGQGGHFFYAPDGQQIALVNDSSLSLVNSDGSNLRPNVLTWKPLGITHEYHRPQPAWLPDSTALLIAPTNAADNIDAIYNPDASSTIWRVPADDAPPQQLTEMMGAPLWSTFSPDGSQVLFEQVSNDKLERELHIAAVDNAWNIVYATEPGLNNQGWLPDSNSFIIRVNREAPLLGRLCQPPLPLPVPETPGSFVRRIEWIDPSRFLFTIDEPPQLLLGDLDGAITSVGSLRQEYFFGVGTLTAFDFSFVE